MERAMTSREKKLLSLLDDSVSAFPNALDIVMNDNESILSKATFELDDIIVNSRICRQTMRKHQMAMKPLRGPEVQQPALKMEWVLLNLLGLISICKFD